MSTVLQTNKSKSNPAREYHIILANDGVTVYCDCMGWKMNKHCRHLDAYQGSLTQVAQTGARQAAKTVKKDPTPTVNQTIDQIVREIGGSS
jgi:hypothetical protein